MSDFGTILVIGGTSGLGREFVRRYHARGKKVIATGRRTERLSELKKELPGIETYEMDILDLQSFAKQVLEITKSHSVDTVFMMSGVMQQYFFAKPSIDMQTAINEVTTNFTAPVVLAYTLVPYFAAQSSTTNIVLVSSGLAYQPLPIYPVYCPTKAAVHYLAVTLRSQLADTKCNIIELNPPYVDSELDAHHREQVMNMLGNSAPQPKPLDEYMESAMKGLDQRDANGKPLKEVSLEFSEVGASKWREAFQSWLDLLHLKG